MWQQSIRDNCKTSQNIHNYQSNTDLTVFNRKPLSRAGISRITHLFSFTFTVSSTNTTSGIVTEVSAMLVDTTILRTPGGYIYGVLCGEQERLLCGEKERVLCGEKERVLGGEKRRGWNKREG